MVHAWLHFYTKRVVSQNQSISFNFMYQNKGTKIHGKVAALK